MKSQESTFSDIQLEDPTGRRSSNAGLCFQLVTLADFFFAHCHVGVFFPPSCVINAANTEASSLQASISPADLHGMWYPTVRRTLVCLSKLYRCIDVSLADFTHISRLVVDFLWSILVFICLIGVLPESSLPRFISRSLICLHSVPA